MSCSGLFCHVFNLANSKLIPFVKCFIFYWTPLLGEEASYAVLTYFCTFHILFSAACVQCFNALSSCGKCYCVSANIWIIFKALALLMRSWSKRQNDVFTLQDFLQRWIVGSWWAERTWPAQRVFKRCACLLHADILTPASSSAVTVYENIASLHNYFIVVLMPYWSRFPPAHMHQNTSFHVMVTWKCKRRRRLCLFSCKS